MKQILKLTLYIPLAFIATWFFYCMGYGLYECIVDRMHVLARGWNLLGIPFACGFNYLLFSKNVRLFSYPLWSIMLLYYYCAYDALKWNTPYYKFEAITTIGCFVLSLVFIWTTRKKESPICHWSGVKRLLFFVLCSVIICGIGFLSEEAHKAIDSYKRQLDNLHWRELEKQANALNSEITIPDSWSGVGLWNLDKTAKVIIYEEEGHFYIDSTIKDNQWSNRKDELIEYDFDGNRAFKYIDLDFGGAEGYYQIIDGKLLEKASDGSGETCWMEPVCEEDLTYKL